MQKRGSWLAFGQEQVGQGLLASTEALRNNPDLAQRIVAEIAKAVPAAKAIKPRPAAGHDGPAPQDSAPQE